MTSLYKDLPNRHFTIETVPDPLNFSRGLSDIFHGNDTVPLKVYTGFAVLGHYGRPSFFSGLNLPGQNCSTGILTPYNPLALP